MRNGCLAERSACREDLVSHGFLPTQSGPRSGFLREGGERPFTLLVGRSWKGEICPGGHILGVTGKGKAEVLSQKGLGSLLNLTEKSVTSCNVD